MLEPVQGEGGFMPMPLDFPRRLKELCEAHGILYVDDEVQAGVGRTGPVWAIEHYGVTPDLLVSGKSLGGGLPLAAVTGRAELMDAVHVGGLGGTFGGNPVACAAASVVLDTVATPEFRRQADELAWKMRDAAGGAGRRRRRRSSRSAASGRCSRSSSRPSSSPAWSPPRASAVCCCSRAGCTARSIRLLPPITISDEELTEGLGALEAALRTV